MNDQNNQNYAFSASRTSSISTFNCGFICEHLLFVQYKTKTKKFANFIIFFRALSKFYKNKKLLNTNFDNS